MPVDLPTLTGQCAYPVELAIRQTAGAVNQVEARVATLANQQRAPLTIDQIRRALGATGSAPLNIFTLIGGSATTGVVQVGTHSQRIALSVAALPSGTIFLETDRSAVYMTSAGAWVFAGNVEMAVTLSPDTKPTDLAAADAGFLIRSTDFDRVYRWTGSAWADAPAQPKRGTIAWFDVTLHADFAPGIGWQLCNGTAAVVRSTPTGTTTTVTVPDLTTANRFLRAVAGATGGTGGSATTHTHTVTPTTDEVQAGVGDVVSDDGTFTTSGPSGIGGDDALPPYINMQPFMRL